MNKTRRMYYIISCIALWLLVNPAIMAQEARGLLDRRNFSFNLALYADAIKYEKSIFDRQESRKSVNDKNTSAVSLPFSSLDWVSDDSSIGIGYETDWFGGKYTFKKSNITNFGAVQGWVKFGKPEQYLKIMAGNDNSFSYADPLGADPGLRIYTGGTGGNWKAAKEPDDITGGNGIALNGVWRNLTVDLAASQFTVTPRKTSTVKPGTVNTYGDTEDMDFQYGGRAGYQISNMGKINISYIMNYNKVAGKFGWDTRNLGLIPTASDAEIYTHTFSGFASLTPITDFAITAGYSGIITKYLDSYWTLNGEMETTFPLVWKHGINLNMRYTGLLNGTLRLRTDNNLSIYKDKNYSSFDVAGSSWGIDYNPSSGGKTHAEIQHLFLWNGLGVEYDLKKYDEDRKIMLTLYARNLFRQDIAGSKVIEQEYKYIRDEVMVDLQVKYFLSSGIHAFAGLRYQNLLTFRSKDLTGQMTGFFLDSMKMPRDAVGVTDNKLTLSIPIGILITF